MIEEELYRRATEELNGPNRRADLWKRAVALATDDHDEARYLYTNLRVEELIEERELAGGTQQFSDIESGQATNHDVQENDNVAEPAQSATGAYSAADGAIEFTPDTGLPISPSSIGTPEPQLSGTSLTDDEIGLDQLSDDLDLTRGSAGDFAREPSRELIGDVSESLRAERAQLQADKEQADAGPTDLGLDDLLPDVDDLADDYLTDDDPTIRISTLDTESAAVTGVMSESTRDIAGAGAAGGAPGTADDTFDPDFDEFLEATSALPDAVQDDAFIEEDNPEIDLDERANQTQDITRHLDDTLDSSLASLDTLGTATGVGATARAIIGQGRKRYNILSHFDGRATAIKQGVSWPALFFTMPWLLIKKLWGTLLVYLIVVAIIVLGGIALALHIDTAPNWTNSMRLTTVCFTALGAAGLLLIPFIRGNHWVARRLQRKGFESRGIIKANSPEHALNQINR